MKLFHLFSFLCWRADPPNPIQIFKRESGSCCRNCSVHKRERSRGSDGGRALNGQLLTQMQSQTQPKRSRNESDFSSTYSSQKHAIFRSKTEQKNSASKHTYLDTTNCRFLSPIKLLSSPLQMHTKPTFSFLYLSFFFFSYKEQKTPLIFLIQLSKHTFQNYILRTKYINILQRKAPKR